MKVYLAGPISGLTYDGAEEWREYVTTMLNQFGIEGYSPLRCKKFLRNHGVLTDKPDYAENILATPDCIMTRDHWDVQTSDDIFVNLLGATKVTIGTVMEIAWAYVYRKPTILVMEDFNVHDHAMILKAGVFRAYDLDQGIHLTRAILRA